MKAEQMHPDDLPPLYYRDRDIALICAGFVCTFGSLPYSGAASTVIYVLGFVLTFLGGWGNGRTRHEARKREFIRSNPDAGRYLR